MIYRGDNYNEQFFGAAMLPLISIPLFWAVFSPDATIIGKIIGGTLGLVLIILPVRSFIYRRYTVLFDKDQISIVYTSKYVKEKTFSYNELESIKFTNPIRGRDHIIFRFKSDGGIRKKFMIELEEKEKIIPLIIHCKAQNRNTKYEALPLHGDLFNFIKRELYKHKINAL